MVAQRAAGVIAIAKSFAAPPVTVTCTGAEVAWLPAVSVTRAVSVCTPGVSAPVSQL